MRKEHVRKLTAFVAALSLALAPRVWSHEGHDHGQRVMGTVTAVHKDMNHVELKLKDGHVTGFKVDGKTKYLRGTKAAALDDIKVGDRVVATVAGEGDAKVATTVKLSSASASTSGEKAPASSPDPGRHKH